jgi:single-strand DNA-binding protein
MANFNQTIIAGQIGSDIEVKYTASSVPVINLSVATNEEWLDKKGNKQKNTYWHKVVYYGKHAEILVNKLKLGKGDSILVEGNLKYEEWEKDGVDMKTAFIHANKVELLTQVNKKNK